ncbi:MAG: Ig-like domain-containing protein, partial [Chloroflexota bacterium]|nr:Ig-like domain-containing protein [Chloroflexota bacterium]
AKVPLKNSVATLLGLDAYLAELSSDASTLTMGTFLGAGGGITLNNNDLHLDAQLNAYFGGSQGVNPYGGTSLPVTPNAFQPTLKGNTAGFVIKFITQQQPSATALAVSPSGSAAPSQTITLTATVTTTSTLVGKIFPTGTVTFLNGSATIGTGTLNAKGVATYSSTLTGGTYNITASYAGDPGFNSSVSSAATLTISSAVATTTTLTVSPATSAYGTGATLTATVLAGKAAATSGTVTFTAGSVTLGTANANAQGVASTTAKPVVGMYSVVATYAGTYNQTSAPTGYAPSTSASVMLTVTKAASTIALTSSTASTGIGSSFTLTGTVPAGATGTVSFYNGTTLLGTGTVGTTGAATLTLSIATAGTYNLSAVYSGDTNYSGSTSTSTVQVVIQVPSFTVTASPASLTIARGSTGTTTLTVTPQGGYTGTLTFACGTLPSMATCTFNPATVTVGAAAVTTTLTIGTGTASASVATPKLFNTHGAIYAGLFFGLLGLARRKKLIKSASLLVALVCLAGLGALTGCGGSNAPSTANETPAGSYTISITGTGTTGSPQAISVAVVVQ